MTLVRIVVLFSSEADLLKFIELMRKTRISIYNKLPYRKFSVKNSIFWGCLRNDGFIISIDKPRI